MFRERFQGATIIRVLGVNRVVFEPRANEIVVAGIIEITAVKSGRRLVIDPQRFHPGVADVAGIGRAGHARAAAWNRTAIARSEKLPLLQGEVRQLIEADELKLRALILVDVAFVAAIAEARG